MTRSHEEQDGGQSFDFGFPFAPYPNQLLLMKKIQKAIEEQKVGVYGSPTGTGKTLTIICAVCDWIVKQRQKRHEALLKQAVHCEQQIEQLRQEGNQSSNWIELQRQQKAEEQKLLDIKEQLKVWESYDRIEARLKQLRSESKVKSAHAQSKSYGPSSSKKMKANSTAEENKSNDDNALECPDEQFLLLTDSKQSNDSQEAEDGEVEEEKDAIQDINVRQLPKIIYCSRTHSQLSQFIHEFQRTIYKDKIRLVSLGSRSNLCVNPAVRALKHPTLVNDKCMELNNKKTKCPFYRANDIEQLAYRLLAMPLDIEQAHEAGRDAKCCAYYSEKKAIAQAELIVVPYNILLNKQTRDAYNLQLDQCVLIVDEAHNLSDTISNAHSIQVTGQVISACKDQVQAYIDRYDRRLSPNNLLHLKQLITLLGGLLKALQPNPVQPAGASNTALNSNNFKSTTNQLNLVKAYTPIAFQIESDIENFNLFKLVDFCETNQLARKLFGFAVLTLNQRQRNNSTVQQQSKSSGTSAFLARMAEKKAKKNKKSNSTMKTQNLNSPPSSTVQTLNQSENDEKLPGSPLFQVLDLLRALTNTSEDGRLLVFKKGLNGYIKYLHLDNGKRFSPIVQECLSLILIGGTMEPVSEFVDLLTSQTQASPTKPLDCFDCGHIIPEENLLAMSIDKGPTGKPFLFQHNSKESPELMKEAGLLLINLCTVVPAGVVVFFTSYSYEQTIFNYWKREKIIERIEAKGKRVFREPRTSSEVPKMLEEYTKCIQQSVQNLTQQSSKQAGAVLLSVVGGKMSEGIDFKDDLSRCVIMFGLPYPNIASPELLEKFRYIDSKNNSLHGNSKVPKKVDPSNTMYLNMCMKAVNQSIGRAIRHGNDYASIWLVDTRYGSDPKVHQRLPAWIRKSYEKSLDFGQAYRKTGEFFRLKKNTHSTC